MNSILLVNEKGELVERCEVSKGEYLMPTHLVPSMSLDEVIKKIRASSSSAIIPESELLKHKYPFKKK